MHNFNSIRVNTYPNPYPIIFSTSFSELFENHINRFISKQIIFVTNNIVAKLYLDKCINLINNKVASYDSIVLPDGEQYKNSDTLNIIYDNLLKKGLSRDSTLIALGGGVIGDMAGFAAATYQRGIRLIHIPTTLLSQVDSSIGGKTGINHPLGKNMIGSFYQPSAVLIGLDFLTTLPKREFISGFGEVVKYALLGDKDFFYWLEDNIDKVLKLDLLSLEYLVMQSCKMKAEIVANDEKEAGNRALLNLGHTFAHAIEVETGYGTWLHGEAVSMGIVLAAKLSLLKGNINSLQVERIINLLKKIGLPISIPKIEFDKWISAMSHDKKVKNGKINFILLEEIGKAIISNDINNEELLEILS